MDSIIFDVDGTLWNSTEITARAWTEYLQETEHMNITITSDQLVSMFGQPLPDIASQIFPERTKAERKSYKNRSGSTGFYNSGNSAERRILPISESFRKKGCYGRIIIKQEWKSRIFLSEFHQDLILIS